MPYFVFYKMITKKLAVRMADRVVDTQLRKLRDMLAVRVLNRCELL